MSVKTIKEFAFDKDMPEERNKAKEKSLKNSLYALVMAALTQVTTVLDDCIQGDKVTKSVQGACGRGGP